MQVTAVVLVEPRGFCAGVESAVKALAWLTALYPPPVYCFHEIVHNHAVVDRFRRLGVRFVDRVDDVPAGAPLMLSAHGSPPEVLRAAAATGGVVVDAVCPLVAKVHHEIATRAAAGEAVVYLGHAGHDEAEGAVAVAPAAVLRVESAADVEQLDDPGRPVALLAQTTLALDLWERVAAAAHARFGRVWTPARRDLCYATTNRQAAVRAVAGSCDATVVVGSATSSNTRALAGAARAAGCATVVRVDGPGDLPALAGRVAVTAGASAPEASVAAVVERLDPSGGVERAPLVAEGEYFPPPPALRRLLRRRAAAGTLDPRLAAAMASDRQLAAGDLLALIEAMAGEATPAATGPAPR